MEEILRLGLAAFVAAALIAGFGALGRFRARRRAPQPALDLAERFGLPPGQPAIIYLAGDPVDGARQEPAFQVLGQRRRVVIHRLRPDAEADLVSQMGIVAFPSTIVIGADHARSSVNAGYADADTLEQQLA